MKTPFPEKQAFIPNRDLAGFVKVSRSNRCQVCGKPDWCMVARDGTAAICPRVPEGALKYLGESGYLHRLSDEVHTVVRQAVSRHIPVEEPTIDAAALMDEYREDMDEVALERLCERLGVSDAALQFLGIGWCNASDAWAFPMSDGAGEVVGIRLRNDTGKKWAVRGSRSGLFIPAVLTGEGALFLVEGPTDTAALIDLDVDVIGRPFCRGGNSYLQNFLRASKRDVVIISDNDGPGVDGAEALAKDLDGFARTLKVIKPVMGKDSREWKSLGLTKETLLWTAKQVPLWRAA